MGIGDTEAVNVTLDKQLPAGPWHAVIELKSGLLDKTAEATLTFPASGAALPVAPLPYTAPNKNGLLTPVTVGAAAGIVVVGGGSLWFAGKLRWRRGKHRRGRHGTHGPLAGT